MTRLRTADCGRSTGDSGLRTAGRTSRFLSIALITAALLPLPACRVLAQTHLLVVSGLGGEPKYAEAFRKWGTALVDAAKTRYGVADSDAVYLAEDGPKDPRIAGISTKENIEKTLARFAQRSGSGEQIVIVLLGHGSGADEDSKLSLPGPDLTAKDLARDLGQFATQPVALVNLTSASGDMVRVLSGANRVVITATKSSFERNESVFGGYFIDALTGDGADTDKDGRVSLLEAFRYAAAETKLHYEQISKLQTEHAQLDDDGDKQGSGEPDPRVAVDNGKGDGLLARRMFIGGGTFAARGGANDPKLAALYKERFALEEKIDALKKKKMTMSQDAYDSELEKLLVELATKSKEIRDLEGRS
jgi:hypothetical protein